MPGEGTETSPYQLRTWSDVGEDQRKSLTPTTCS